MKKMIIVCSDKRRKQADFLSQLISGIPSDNKLAGTTVVVWSINDYKANSPKISSEQYILFIGNSELIKEKEHI